MVAARRRAGPTSLWPKAPGKSWCGGQGGSWAGGGGEGGADEEVEAARGDAEAEVAAMEAVVGGVLGEIDFQSTEEVVVLIPLVEFLALYTDLM